MNEAIKLAIENGYSGENLPFDHDTWLLHEYIILTSEAYSVIAQDPLFWQALDKALGWKSTGLWKEPGHHEVMEWEMYALNYFELVLTRGDENAFWKELLKR